MVDDAYRIRPALAAHAPLIAQLSRESFDDGLVPESSFVSAIGEWQERRSPVLVATGSNGTFLGYVRCKPNETNDTVSRFDGQVAVLAQVAVVPAARGRGVGTALTERALKALRLFQYTRVFAQVQPTLVGWYAQRGWDVHPAGQCPAWIEPTIPSDNDWFPEVPKGSFAPLLSMFYLSKYPHVAEYKLRDAQPIVEVWIDGRANEDEVIGRSHRAIIAYLDTHPELEDRVPSSLLKMLRA